MAKQENTIKAMKIVQEFLGLEDWQKVPQHFWELVESISNALEAE